MYSRLQRLVERHGVFRAFMTTLTIGLFLWPMVNALAPHPSSGLLETIAQVGATLLVAYGVVMTGAIRRLSARGADERWIVQAAVGFGLGGLFGIGLSLGLVDEANPHGHWTPLHELLFSWAIASIALLGIFVVLEPDLAVSRENRTGADRGRRR